MILGAAIAVGSIVMLIMAYTAGEMRGAHIARQDVPDPCPKCELDRINRQAPDDFEIDDEVAKATAEKAKAIRQGFMDMMSYDVTKAVKGDRQ